MTLPFMLPPLTEGGSIPQWKNNGFMVGQELLKILQYSANTMGWCDELTEFHEESAGDQHFIDRASRNYAMKQIKKYSSKAKPVILEVGCSSGFMLQRISQTLPDAVLIGSDVVEEPLKKLAKNLPEIPLLRFDMTRCPLPDNCIDTIVMLNVLEHIEDDSKALEQAYRILKPGGALVIEVPAGPNLYDAYDKVLMHYRRYSSTSLSQILKKQGFKIQKKSHLGFFLYPAFWLVKKRNKRLLSETEQVQRQQVEKIIQQTGDNKLLHFIMQLELLMGKILSYPIGARCIFTCVK